MKRTYWKDDVVFIKFNDRLYKESWTFEETLKISTIDTLTFKSKKEDVYSKMKEEWLKHIIKWNEEENIDVQDKIFGYAALTFIFMVLPYNELDNVGKFTEFEANQINICYFYNTNGDYLPFKNMEELFNAGPIYPPAYKMWIEDKYNQASWWITYMVYERINNLSPIMDSPSTQL